MPEEKKAETIRKKLVCVALARVAGSKKLLPEFSEVDADGAAKPGTACFDIKATVGHVYEIDASKWDDDGKVIAPSTLRWVGQYEDRDKRVEWESRADTDRANHARAKMRERAEKSTALAEVIRPLAKAYRKLVLPDDKRAFLAMVVNEIANPKKED